MELELRNFNSIFNFQRIFANFAFETLFQMSKSKLLFTIFLFSLFGSFASSAQKAKGPSQSVSAADDRTKYKVGNAWTLSYPLGTHEASTIDTLLYNYQRQFIPSLNSDAWATTGVFAGEGMNLLFFQRPQRSQFLFEDGLRHYLPTFDKEKFYNVYIPMTLLSYNFGGGRETRNDALRATFAGNVNRKIGIGANINYLYTKGSYDHQAAKNMNFGFKAYYNGDRYEAQAFINQYNTTNQENGGITDDLYITDPAVLQGGVATIEPKSIPVRLSTAQNRLIGSQFYMTHAYKLGFWRDDTQPEDTVERKTFIPVTKFIYAFDYKFNHRIFRNLNATQAREFWKDTFFNLDESNDQTYYWSLSNTFGISMIEGFQKWAKFGLSAYISYEIDRFRQEWLMPNEEETNPTADESLSPVPENVSLDPIKKRSRLWVGGRLEKMKGNILRYYANAKFGLLGDAIGDIDIDGHVETRFRLGKDTVVIAADGFFRNTEPSYLLQHYIGNHFVWDNDFGKTRDFRVGGHLHIPWTSTDLRAGVENIQNYIYFDAESMPRQHSGSIQVFSASIEQKLKFGIWNWNNTVTYQTSSNKDVLPLPQLSVYSNMFLSFTAFKVLHLQIGLDCDWYTKYNGYDYQPATMSFHVQGENPIKTGNFPMANLYMDAKLYKTRFFVAWTHVNQGLFKSNYFSLPHYPISPRMLRFGISIDFAN